VIFFKKNIVFISSLCAALVSSFFIPPDRLYANYFSYRTLTSLFCVLAVVCALRNINFFSIIAGHLVTYFSNTRSCILAVVYITFIGSMLIANDMALITFLPLGFYVLAGTDNEKYAAFLFIMQNIAANLGGMLTPFGNPQNIYLYLYFNIPGIEFMRIMLPSFILSIALITVCCMCIKKGPMKLRHEYFYTLPGLHTLIYIILFIFSILIIFKIIPYQYGLIIIPVSLFFLDKKSLLMVDYPLLLTFTAFFVFAGNVSRMYTVQSFFTQFLDKSTFLSSIVSCQIISNVPSAILLSQFTSNYRELLTGVNIGGVGTFFASLASLITFREYQRRYPKKILQYSVLFLIFNFSFLIVLTAFQHFINNSTMFQN